MKKNITPALPDAPANLSSGNAIVDRIGQMHFEGNIIDHRWTQHPLLKLPNGKLNGPALLVLADLVYWFRPSLIRDPVTNQIIEVRKKFREADFWKDYASWADSLGLTKRQVQDAIAFLKKHGLIRFRTGTVQLHHGAFTNNVPIIELVPELLSFITYGIATAPTRRRDTPHVITGHPTRSNARPHTPQRDTVRDQHKRSKRDQQQGAVVVEAANAVNDLPAEVLITQDLWIETGVAAPVANKLIEADPAEARRQIDYLPFRKAIKDPAATLVTATKENWPPPAQWHADQKRQQSAQADAEGRRSAAQQAAAQKAQRENAAQKAQNENDQLDAYYKSLAAPDRADIDDQAQRRVQPLALAGLKPGPALAAARRNIIRKELGIIIEDDTE
jgi:hypothetical protein